MKFTLMNEDVSHVSKLPDTPSLENGYTPDTLKGVFDRAGEDIKSFINTALIPELEGSDVGSDGASRIGSAPIESVEGESVQEKLVSLAAQIQDIANSSIPDGTIVPEKFVDSVASFITEGSVHIKAFDSAGTYTFTPTRSGNYKISVQGAGGGGCIATYLKKPAGGGSGAFACGVFRLEKGIEYTVKVGQGGKGLCIDSSMQLISYGQNGGDSGFYLGDEEIIFAQGGRTRHQSEGAATARGGVINKSGGFPMCTEYNSTVGIEYGRGACSLLGESSRSRDGASETGAGGMGASYAMSVSEYLQPGSDGGDGAVIIEWME